MKSVLIKNASVFNGQVFLPDHCSIYLRDNLISDIFPPGETPTSDIIIDAKGNTVMPALIDGHCHFMARAWQKYSLDLSGTDSIDDVASRLSVYTRNLPPGEWARGGGWSFHVLGKENMTMDVLDSHCHGHPVALESMDFHSVWINTSAREFLGLPKNPSDNGDAVYGRDGHGRFNGILFENARNIVYEKVPDPSPEWISNALKKSIRDWYSYGFSGCVGMEMEKDITYLNQLFDSIETPFRLSWFAPVSILNELIRTGVKSGEIFRDVTLGGIKLFADGAFGSLTAEMNSSYNNSSNSGVAVLPQKEMVEYISRAHRHSLATAVHAIGDKAIDRVMQAYEHSIKETPLAVNLKNRIEHLQVPGENAMNKMGDWQIGAAIQPCHIPADISIIAKHLPDRQSKCYPFKTLQTHQVPLIMSSDAPVADINPWRNIYISITQKDPDNADQFLNLNETITLEESLKAYTKTAAEYGYLKHSGEIKKGNLADIIILNQDLSKLKMPRQILNTELIYTIIDGQIVYTNQEKK